MAMLNNQMVRQWDWLGMNWDIYDNLKYMLMAEKLMIILYHQYMGLNWDSHLMDRNNYSHGCKDSTSDQAS